MTRYYTSDVVLNRLHLISDAQSEDDQIDENSVEESASIEEIVSSNESDHETTDNDSENDEHIELSG